MATAATLEDLQIKDAAAGTNLAEFHRDDAPDSQAEFDRLENKGLQTLTPMGTKVSVRFYEVGAQTGNSIMRVIKIEDFTIYEWFIDDALEISQDLANFALNFMDVDKSDNALVIATIMSRLDVVVKILARTIGREETFVRRISMESLVELIKAVRTENPNFFRQLAELWQRNQPARATSENPGTTESAPTQSETENRQASETPLTGSA